MVIGDQGLQPQLGGAGHAFHAGNAVVYCDQHVCALRLHAVRDRSREPITIDHTVWHEIAHLASAEQLQAAHADGAGRGAIAVVIGHDAQPFVCGNRIGQQTRRLQAAFHGRGRQKLGQPIVQLVQALHAASGIQFGQKRVNACIFKRPGASRRGISNYQFHSISRIFCMG